jgi:hypothetical protein
LRERCRISSRTEYKGLAPVCEQFLSRSRVHTPPVKDKQRIVHALCTLNEATVKHQTTYEDLHMFNFYL